MDIETGPLGGTVLIGLAIFLALGFLLLSGLITLVIWAAIGVVVAGVIYFGGIRVWRRLAGEGANG